MNVFPTVDKKSRKLSKKLKNLRREHLNIQNMLGHNDGSRKLSAQKYVKNADDGEFVGAPFPNNLRPSRRNRPHTRSQTQNSQEYVVSVEDLEERNPIVASKQVVDIPEDGKALMRKSPKFCPTPRGPIEEMEHYKDFLRFQQSIRWKWFFHKEKDPKNIVDSGHGVLIHALI